MCVYVYVWNWYTHVFTHTCKKAEARFWICQIVFISEVVYAGNQSWILPNTSFSFNLVLSATNMVGYLMWSSGIKMTISTAFKMCKYHKYQDVFYITFMHKSQSRSLSYVRSGIKVGLFRTKYHFFLTMCSPDVNHGCNFSMVSLISSSYLMQFIDKINNVTKISEKLPYHLFLWKTV